MPANGRRDLIRRLKVNECVLKQCVCLILSGNSTPTSRELAKQQSLVVNRVTSGRKYFLCLSRSANHIAVIVCLCVTRAGITPLPATDSKLYVITSAIQHAFRYKLLVAQLGKHPLLCVEPKGSVLTRTRHWFLSGDSWLQPSCLSNRLSIIFSCTFRSAEMFRSFAFPTQNWSRISRFAHWRYIPRFMKGMFHCRSHVWYCH